MAYFKPSYGVNGLGIPMGPMDAATLHHSMGYATGEKLQIKKLRTTQKLSYFITRQIFNILIRNLFLLSVIVHNPCNGSQTDFYNSSYSI